jgi:hypothetical protein
MCRSRLSEMNRTIELPRRAPGTRSILAPRSRPARWRTTAGQEGAPSACTGRQARADPRSTGFDQGRGRYFRRRCCRILESLATFCFPLPRAPLNSPCRQGTPAKRTTALDHASIRHPRAPPWTVFNKCLCRKRKRFPWRLCPFYHLFILRNRSGLGTHHRNPKNGS